MKNQTKVEFCIFFPVCLVLQFNCPIPSDQLSLLRLLSSTAHQELTMHSPKSEVKFIGANGDTFEEEHLYAEKVDGPQMRTSMRNTYPSKTHTHTHKVHTMYTSQAPN